MSVALDRIRDDKNYITSVGRDFFKWVLENKKHDLSLSTPWMLAEAVNDLGNIKTTIKVDLHATTTMWLTLEIKGTHLKYNPAMPFDEFKRCYRLYESSFSTSSRFSGPAKEPKSGKEPKNNDGREYCYWCNEKTEPLDMWNYFGNVCPRCKK